MILLIGGATGIAHKFSRIRHDANEMSRVPQVRFEGGAKTTAINDISKDPTQNKVV
jgi:hypothetical protein